MVFNPHAAFRRARRLLPRLNKALEAFARVDVVQTTGPGDAMRQVEKATLTDYDGLIAAGGDGTLFEVLNGLYRHEPERRIPLGLLPVGTGNAFARDLGLLPGDWEKGVALLREARLRRVDVGRVEQGHGQAGNQAFHFLNIIGAGLPVDAMRTAERIKFVGRSAYSLAAFWRAMRLKSFTVSIELDGELIEQDVLFLEISNTRYTGTHFLMAPGAQFDDGLLDVTLVRRLPRLFIFRVFT
jgi:diacylglycerol kinase (ATP)